MQADGEGVEDGEKVVPEEEVVREGYESTHPAERQADGDPGPMDTAIQEEADAEAGDDAEE